MPLATGTYHDKLDLISAPITYDVILRLPWLIRYNPHLDWPLRTLTFETEFRQRHTLTAPTEEPQDTNDTVYTAKQLNRILQSKTRAQEHRVYLCTVKSIDQFYQSVEDATKDQPEYLCNVLLDYDEVFQDVDFLPPHRDIDHAIPLVPDSTPPWKNLYHMSADELTCLKDELE